MKSIDYLRSTLSEERIFEMCFNEPILLTRNDYRNPCRKDSKGTNSFFKSRTGKLLFRDFSTGKSYDCFDIVREYYGLSNIVETIKYISNHFGLTPSVKELQGLTPSQMIANKLQRKEMANRPQRVTFKLKLRLFDNNDTQFFDSANISRETLDYFNIRAVHGIHADNPKKGTSGIIYNYNGKYDNICYRYMSEYKNYKIYRPNGTQARGDFKWLSNMYPEEMMGKKELVKAINEGKYSNKIIIITSGLRDMLCTHQAGFLTIAPSSEVAPIHEMNIKYLNQLKEQGFRVIIIYDSDEVGRTKSEGTALATGFEFFPLPAIPIGEPVDGVQKYTKDITDISQNFGISSLTTLLNYIINP